LPAKLDRCVEHVKGQGHSEESAYAICNAVLKGDAMPAGTDEAFAKDVTEFVAQLPTDEDEADKVEKANSPNNDPFSLFIPITKIDVEKQEVWGRATREEPDNSGEIFDYNSSKPYFQEWSQTAQKRSGGKSKGNVRAMHQLTAAGKVIDLQTVDEDKSIFVGAKIVDGDEWKKVQEGVYTGFSVGGNYVRRWPDRQFTRYTAAPNEISLVDVPCVASATFEMVKADGAEQAHFKGGEGKTILPLSPGELEKVEVDNPAPAEQIEAVTIAQEVGGQPYNQVQPPVKPLEIDPNPPIPDGKTLANAGAPAINLDEAAAPLLTEPSGQVSKIKISKTKKKGILKVAKKKVTKKLSKMDVANLVDGARSMVASLKEQAESGEVDQALLDQVSGALEVATDYVADMETELEDEAGQAAGALGEDVVRAAETPEVKKEDEPEKPEMAKEGEGESEMEKEDGEEKPEMAKALTNQDGPMTMAPAMPDFYVWGAAEDAMATVGPRFSKALAGNNVNEANRLAGYSRQTFDRMLSMSLHNKMSEMGITAKNLQAGNLQKALTSASVPGINLLPLARLMLPVYSGLCRRLPADSPRGMGSNQATWRAQLGFGALAEASLLSVAEAATGPASAEAFLTFQAPYRPVTQNDSVTLTSTFASAGYDDPLQVAVIYTLSGVIRGRERKVLGDNAAAIATPGQPTGTFINLGLGSLADGNYLVKVTALTYRGWFSGSTGGAAAVGETVAGVASAAVAVAGGGNTAQVSATWAAVAGAVAYNVFVSNDGGANYFYSQTVTVNAATISTMPVAGNDSPAADTSVNANGYEGLLSWAELATVYGQAIPTKTTITDNANAALTTNGSGITEFDAILSSLWSNWNISPTAIVTSSNGVAHYTAQIMTLNQPQYRVDVTGEQNRLVGGTFVTTYANKFATWADGSQQMIDMIAHPYMPDGTFLFLCESIPYPMSREARGFALETLVPFTYFPLAQTTIAYPFAITQTEVPECFHPSAQTALVGVDVS
jgi:hypothetical protein